MAATYSYRPQLEITRYPQAPTQPLQITWGTAAETGTLTSNTNPRPTPQIPTNVPPDSRAENKTFRDIDQLCRATLIIDQAFYNIGQRLSDISKEQNKRIDLYSICHSLETRWNQHYLTYKDLIWRSREFAGEAQSAVDDFYKHVLPFLMDKCKSRPEKQRVIGAQIRMLQSKSQPSQTLSQDFVDFGRALNTYITDFSRDVEGLDTCEQNVKVDGLKDELCSTRDDMEAISKEVAEIGWKLVGVVTVAGIAVLLGFVAPTFWQTLPPIQTIGMNCMNVKNSLVQYLDMRRRYNLAVAKYETTKAEYELEGACLNQMMKLKSTLQDAMPLVHEVTAKLGIFASVWAAIWADIGNLKRALQYADDPASPIFTMRVATLKTMYEHLSEALHHYQVTVQLPQWESV